MTTQDTIFSVKGRVAILTGASSGLGEHFARALHEAGANIVAAARRLDRLDRLADELPGVLPVRCDINSWHDLDQLVGRARDHFGTIDLLINNAGVATGGTPAQDELREDIDRTISTNLVAPLRLAQLVFPDMRDSTNAGIVNVVSISGLVGIGRIPQASYAASKGALIALTRELAIQWGRYGIRVNAIAPGFFMSPATVDMFEIPKLSEWVKGNTPLRHQSTTNDYVGALLYLASSASSNVTGQVMVVDGGWTAR